jgi:hypothetical protein
MPIEMVGLAVAFPISIGIALVEGVVLSYAIQPKGSAGLCGMSSAAPIAGRDVISRACSRPTCWPFC